MTSQQMEGKGWTAYPSFAGPRHIVLSTPVSMHPQSIQKKAVSSQTARKSSTEMTLFM